MCIDEHQNPVEEFFRDARAKRTFLTIRSDELARGANLLGLSLLWVVEPLDSGNFKRNLFQAVIPLQIESWCEKLILRLLGSTHAESKGSLI